MRRRVLDTWWKVGAAGLLLAGLVAQRPALAQEGKSLERGFVHPPGKARPWVYWFWLNGNITREGITADLEAMQRVGIGGVLIMEVDQGAPVGPADFAGPKWRELFKHVCAEARRLGLEVNMNNDAGWNGSGGPWITPEQSMQKVVWTRDPGARAAAFEAALPQPEKVAGYYGDIAVLAVPDAGGTLPHRGHPGQGGVRAQTCVPPRQAGRAAAGGADDRPRPGSST